MKEYFFTSPTSKLKVINIEKLRQPLPSVIKYYKELKDEGILTTIRIENVVF